LVQCWTSNAKYITSAQEKKKKKKKKERKKKEIQRNCIPLSPDTALTDNAFKAAVVKKFKDEIFERR
jgi:hypothetical protein